MKPSLVEKVSLLILLIFAAGCRTAPTESGNVESQIRGVLEIQAREWNAGHLRGFMAAYLTSEQTRFAGGADVIRGWQRVLDRYEKKYGSDSTSMGTLGFSDLEVTVLAPDAVEAFGRWHLQIREKRLDGVFTLLLRRTSQGWRIIHDHSS